MLCVECSCCVQIVENFRFGEECRECWRHVYVRRCINVYIYIYICIYVYLCVYISDTQSGV